MTSNPHFKVTNHDVIFRPIDALDVLCVQLTHDLFAIAKFLHCVHMRLLESVKANNMIGLLAVGHSVLRSSV